MTEMYWIQTPMLYEYITSIFIKNIVISMEIHQVQTCYSKTWDVIKQEIIWICGRDESIN